MMRPLCFSLQSRVKSAGSPYLPDPHPRLLNECSLWCPYFFLYSLSSFFVYTNPKFVNDFFSKLKTYSTEEARRNFRAKRETRRFKTIRGQREIADEIIDQVWKVKIQNQSEHPNKRVGLQNENEWVSVDSRNGKVFKIDLALRHLCALMDYVSLFQSLLCRFLCSHILSFCNPERV